jgi:hypothetical protein
MEKIENGKKEIAKKNNGLKTTKDEESKKEEGGIAVQVFDSVVDPQPQKSPLAIIFADHLKDIYKQLLVDLKIPNHKIFVKVEKSASEPVFEITGANTEQEEEIKSKLKDVKDKVWDETIKQLWKFFKANH